MGVQHFIQRHTSILARAHAPEGIPSKRTKSACTVVQFIKQTAGDEHRNLAAFFDQMRRKRNRLIYDAANLVGKKECQKALSLAHELVALLNNLIKQE